MCGILDMGGRVPEDFSSVGCDGTPFTHASSPRLTTISFPVRQIAKTVCDLVMGRLEHKGEEKAPEKDIVIVPQ